MFGKLSLFVPRNNYLLQKANMKFVVTLVLLTVFSANSLTITNYGETSSYQIMYIDEVILPPLEGKIQNKTIEFKPVSN